MILTIGMAAAILAAADVPPPGAVLEHAHPARREAWRDWDRRPVPVYGGAEQASPPQPTAASSIVHVLPGGLVTVQPGTTTTIVIDQPE